MVINIVIIIYIVSVLLCYICSKQATIGENKYSNRNILWSKGERNIIIFASLCPVFNIIVIIAALFAICKYCDIFNIQEESKW